MAQYIIHQMYHFEQNYAYNALLMCR